MAKKVVIKDFLNNLEVKNSGVEFEVRHDGRHIGDLYVCKTGLVWCKGRTARGNGIKASWEEFVEFMEDE